MVVHLLAGNRQEIEKAREKLFSDFLYSIFSIFLCNNKGVTKQYINSIKIAKLYSPGKVNTRYVSGKDNQIWLLRKDKVSKNSYIFHDLSVIFSFGLTV